MIVGQEYNQGKFPIIEKETEPRIVAYTTFTGLENVGKQIWVVRDWLKAHGFTPAGAPGCIFHYSDPPTPCASPDSIPCEVQWPVAGAPTGRTEDGPIRLKQCPSEQVLSTYHQGDTETIDETFAFLSSVLKKEGYQKDGPIHEIYLFDVNYPKSRWITEAQIPVKKAGP